MPNLLSTIAKTVVSWSSSESRFRIHNGRCTAWFYLLADAVPKIDKKGALDQLQFRHSGSLQAACEENVWLMARSHRETAGRRIVVEGKSAETNVCCGPSEHACRRL